MLAAHGHLLPRPLACCPAVAEIGAKPLPPETRNAHMCRGGYLSFRRSPTRVDEGGAIPIDDVLLAPRGRRSRLRELTWISRNSRTVPAVSFNLRSHSRCARDTSNSPPTIFSRSCLMILKGSQRD